MHYLQAELYDLVKRDSSIFEFLQSGSLDGIWYWDIERPENEWLSPRFWELFGFDPAEKKHLAAEWQDIIHPDDLAVALDNFKQHCADPSHPYDQVVRYRHKDGGTVWVRCRGIALRDAEGRAVRMLGAHNDLTQMMRAREALAATADGLRRSNAELEQFAYAASHDLQAPLRTIAGYIDVLSERLSEKLDAEEKVYMERVALGARDLSAFINDLLAYSRVGRDRERRANVSLGEMVEKIRADLAGPIREAGATLVAEELPVVHGDPALLRQLLQNLVDNAVKYRSPERAPVVRIAAHAQGNRWEIAVADNGQGIDPRFHERIFELFRRLEPKRGAATGTGVGLALCRKIVDLHGGEIAVDSAPGRGSTFTFTLPAARPS